MNSITSVIQIATIIISILIIVLGGTLILILYKNKKDNLEDKDPSAKDESSKKTHGSNGKVQTVGSIKKFMEFDDIVDNMIVRKNRQQYVMVIKCKGVNYDLLSEAEKISVENGFTQFLNTLRFPVQLYIQTRSLNLKDTVDFYTSKVEGMKQEIDNIDIQIKKAKLSGDVNLQERLEFDKRRKMNVLEYGADITDYIGKMSLNKNVLQQNTYVIVSYYTSEIGGDLSNYSKQEIDNMCFNELYIRTQAVIRGLANAEVYGKMLDSEELAELLYIAYNRDDAEVLQLRKALDAEYDSFYSTAPDIMQKKIQKLQAEVEEEAIVLATESVLEADRLIMMQRRKRKMVKERAVEIVEDYRDQMEKDLYLETKKQISEYDTSEDGKTTVKLEKPKRTRKKKIEE